VRTGGWSPRTIDIDVLIFGQTDIDTERLQLPHPRIGERDFVLRPLADIAPELQLLGQPAKTLLDKLALVELERVAGSLR
jgi:2-amino-4-hydroxy-6-hydroxymethyldihydropteridine diphosphokinase